VADQINENSSEPEVRAPDSARQQPLLPEDVDELEQLARLVEDLIENNPDVSGIDDWHPDIYETQRLHKETPLDATARS
jgi:hypothetical protein